MRQGCLLLPFLFLLAIDWMPKTFTAQRGNGIQWTPWTQLDDLDFADNLAILSRTQQQMQEKTSMVADNSDRLGLKVHRGKTKVLMNSTAVNIVPITLEGNGQEDVTSFTYLGSIVDNQGGTDANVKVRTGRGRAAFFQVKNNWTSPNLTFKIKIRIFNTTVKPVLLYGAETWRTTAATLKKIQTFINTCLRKILRIRWPESESISNRELWKQTKQQPAEDEVLQRCWRWIGHTLRKRMTCITCQALTWNPQGKRKQGHPRNTWHRDLEAETKRSEILLYVGTTWEAGRELGCLESSWRQPMLQ